VQEIFNRVLRCDYGPSMPFQMVRMKAALLLVLLARVKAQTHLRAVSVRAQHHHQAHTIGKCTKNGMGQLETQMVGCIKHKHRGHNCLQCTAKLKKVVNYEVFVPKMLKHKLGGKGKVSSVIVRDPSIVSCWRRAELNFCLPQRRCSSFSDHKLHAMFDPSCANSRSKGVRECAKCINRQSTSGIEKYGWGCWRQKKFEYCMDEWRFTACKQQLVGFCGGECALSSAFISATHSYSCVYVIRMKMKRVATVSQN
jgi:hypothetical protein